jgi:hypothetical protein
VNLAGVEVILNLREQLDQAQGEVDRLLRVVKDEIRDRRAGIQREHALVRVEGGPLAITRK